MTDGQWTGKIFSVAKATVSYECNETQFEERAQSRYLGRIWGVWTEGIEFIRSDPGLV